MTAPVRTTNVRTLFPDEQTTEPKVMMPKLYNTGVLPAQDIRAMIGDEINAMEGIDDSQIQPASLDLRLGDVAYRVRASFLPGTKSTVKDKITQFGMHKVDLTDGAVLEKGCVYIVPLQESLCLRKRTSAIANPKSSTGRLDVFARLITDFGAEFDRVRDRYQGPLYAEISPRSFSILARTGSRLVQLRVKRGSPPASDRLLRNLDNQVGLVNSDPGGANIEKGSLLLTVDTEGADTDGLIGYRAKKHAGLVDLERIGYYDPIDFWDTIHARKDGGIILDPDDFYILASREAITVPPDFAAEMMAYDTSVGEFRIHYAGFFDPGFGDAEVGAGGTRAVLEVRSHEVPFIIDVGQVVGRLIYERMTARPERLYGTGIGSSYQRQGLKLSKHFQS
jgi:dCTP deaminase